MSIHKSLKKRSALARARNVLRRDERITRLLDQDRWKEGDSPFGLQKVRVYRLVAKKTKKKAKDDAAATTAADDKKKKK